VTKNRSFIDSVKGRIGSIISLQLLCSDIMMLQEKTARMMYAKNRQRIVHHKRGFFVVNFYNNCDVLMKENQDEKAEFTFNVPRVLDTLDAEFTKTLTNYLVYGKNHE
jgi:hypothetical protein